MLTPKQVKQNEEMLATVLPEVATLARRVMGTCYEKGIYLLIPRTGGYRPPEMQNEIAKDPTHTNAKAWWSWHNFKRALDFVLVIDGGEVDWRDIADDNHDGLKDYDQMGAIAKSLGFIWGGDWKHPHDVGHIEYHPGMTIQQARAQAGIS